MILEKHQLLLQRIIKNNIIEFEKLCDDIKNDDDLGALIRCCLLDELDRYLE